MSKRFDEDNYKHWKDTFKFQSYNDETAEYKDVKLNMEDVMDRIDHYRKKYDEDDAFVRAVIDTHENVVKIMFTKDLAHLIESITIGGLAKVLQSLREGRGEMEIWSVARPADGNWFLVKGTFSKKELANMNLTKKVPEDKNPETKENPETGLKKKEETAVQKLKTNEVLGLENLPVKIKSKVREKMTQGWSPETPYPLFKEFYNESQINSIFNDKIIIYKLKPTKEFFDSLVDNSPKISLQRGFCRSIFLAKADSDISDNHQKIVNHVLDKCDKKYKGKLGIYNRF
jgi:hypothetical protein